MTEEQQEKKEEELKIDSKQPAKPKTDQNIGIEEVFDNPDYGALGLGDELKLYKGLKWTIWENIEFMRHETNKA